MNKTSVLQDRNYFPPLKDESEPTKFFNEKSVRGNRHTLFKNNYENIEPPRAPIAQW